MIFCSFCYCLLCSSYLNGFGLLVTEESPKYIKLRVKIHLLDVMLNVTMIVPRRKMVCTINKNYTLIS